MMKLLFVLIIGFFSTAAQAQIEFGVAGGFRSNQADTSVPGAEVTSKSGLQLGLAAHFPISSIWGVRSGFLYTQRYVDLGPTLSGDVEIQFSYFDVPITPMFRFNDYFGVFAGPVIAFNSAKDTTCSTRSDCASLGVSSMIFPLQLGIQMRFFYQMGAEFFYEYVSGDLSNDVSNMRTVGGNLIFYFE